MLLLTLRKKTVRKLLRIPDEHLEEKVVFNHSPQRRKVLPSPKRLRGSRRKGRGDNFCISLRTLRPPERTASLRAGLCGKRINTFQDEKTTRLPYTRSNLSRFIT